MLGAASIVFSSVDMSTRSVIGGRVHSYVNDRGETVPIPLYLSDVSMWATIGKGIWTGLFFMVAGIVAICSQRERTSKAVTASTILASLSAIFGLFLMISAASQLEKYRFMGPNSTKDRTNAQNTEYTMNALLLTTGLFAFLIGSMLACCGCFIDSCRDARSGVPRGPITPRAFAPTPFPPRFGPRMRMF